MVSITYEKAMVTIVNVKGRWSQSEERKRVIKDSLNSMEVVIVNMKENGQTCNNIRDKGLSTRKTQGH